MQVTPLGLTAEQMVLSNPEAVAKIQADAAAADRKRLGELQAAFPNEAAFAVQAHAEGLSVAEAKAKLYDTLAERTAKLETENVELKKQVEGSKVTFSATDKGQAEGKTPVLTKSTDELNAEAATIWNASSELRNEFNGEFEAFKADFKRFPQDYRKK